MSRRQSAPVKNLRSTSAARTGTITFESGALVTLKDNAENKDSIPGAITNNGVLELNGVEVSNSSGYAITNSSTLYIRGSTKITSKDSSNGAIMTTGTVDITSDGNNITGNVLLSGTNAKLKFDACTITGDLLLDNTAATNAWSSNVSISGSGKFVKGTTEIITPSNKDNLLAYQATTSATNYNVGESGWYANGTNTWKHLTAQTENDKLGEFSVTLSGAQSVAADATLVATDSTNSVVAISGTITAHNPESLH